MRRQAVLGLVLTLAIAAAAVSVALAAAGKQSARPHAKLVRAAAVASKPKRAHKASASSVETAKPVRSRSHTAALVAARAGTRTAENNPGENSATDPDNVQQGDQSGPEDNAQVAEAETTPGDASVDHVEQPAGADHQCPPDCSAGEQP